MKTKLIALAIAAFASTAAMADATVTNADSQYDLKVIYKIPGKQYGASSEAYGAGYDDGKITVYPFEEALIAPGKTLTVKGAVIQKVKMVPGPDMTKFFAEHSLG